MKEASGGVTKDSVVAYLGLGSNLGDRLANLRMALRLLALAVSVRAVSPLYETEPVGVTEQPPFYNAVCCVESRLTPRDLLGRLKEIERRIGRTAGLRWGPRPIDLDILLYGDAIVKEPDLEVPHPRLAERAFVLAPLAELEPKLGVPPLGRTVEELLAAVDSQGVRRIRGRGWEQVGG